MSDESTVKSYKIYYGPGLEDDDAALMAYHRELLASEPGDPTEVRVFDYSAVRLWVQKHDRLQAIVDKLPKTADGVPVVPGMPLWFWDSLVPESPPHQCVPQLEWFSGHWLLDDFDPGLYYSTKTAALAQQDQPAGGGE